MSDQREYHPGPERPAGRPTAAVPAGRPAGRPVPPAPPAAAHWPTPTRPPGPRPQPAGGVPLLTHDSAVGGWPSAAYPAEAGAPPPVPPSTPPARPRAPPRGGYPPPPGPPPGRRRHRAHGGGPRPPSDEDGGRRRPRRLLWTLVTLLGPGPARAGGGVPRRLGHVRRPVGEPDRRHAGGHVQVRRRRRAGHHPAGQRQPHDRPARTERAQARPAGRALGGGPLVLLQPRLRPHGHRPGPVEPGDRRGRRRLDHHPAVREGLHRAGPGVAAAQVQGDRARGQDLPGAEQGPDPRELPERHLLRPRRLRHPGRQPGLLRQGRRATSRCPRARCSPASIQSPSRWDPAKNLEKSTERWNFVLDGMVAQGWLPAADRAQQQFPAFLPRRRRQRRRHPRRRRRPRLQAGDGRARGPRDHRAGDQHRGPHDRPDDRLEAPGAGRHGGDEGARGTGHARQPAGRAGVGRPEDRGDHRLLRRVERGGHRLRPGPAPAGLVVQAVRAVGGAAGQAPDRRPRQHLRRVVPAGLPGRGGQQLRGVQLQPVHGAGGDDQVGQHRLLQDGHRHRAPAGRRRRAPGRDPGRRAAHPHGGHLARRQGGPPDRHGVGVRDVRRRRDAPRRVPGVEGDGGRRPGHLRPRHRDRAAGGAAAGGPQRHRGDDPGGPLGRDRARGPRWWPARPAPCSTPR